MSLANVFMANISAPTTLNGLWDFINKSYNYGERVTTAELHDIFEMTKSALTGEQSVVFMAAGSACFLTVAGIWRICSKIMNSGRSKKEDSSPRRRLLQLIKKAHLPGCIETIIEEINVQELDINEKVASSGLTYFLCGCLSGNADLIKYMIKMGADVNARTNEGDTALYLTTYAVLHSVQSNIDSLRALIRAGCSVNEQNQRGYTPLHRAASKGNLQVIQYLLLEGADPYIANNAGVYPIDSATCAGHIEAAGLLKLRVPNPFVWDVVEPHTPPHIQMGLQSPQRKLLLDSSRRPMLRNVFT